MADTFLGQSITDMVNQTDARYFYGLRRTDDGELFFAKIDQLDPKLFYRYLNLLHH